MLSEEHASFNETIDVRGYFDCEKICLGRGIMCVGANVIVTEGSYNCSLANEMHGNITNSTLLGNRNGKFIIKTTGKYRLASIFMINI